jgi:histone H3/H4
MTTLTRASQQLFERSADERFESFQELYEHCQREKQFSSDLWRPPQSLLPSAIGGEVAVTIDEGETHRLNDWSFSQLCRMAGIQKETVNRLSPETASQALRETLPTSGKPMQLLAAGKSIRSLHGASYTRLWNAELLSVIAEFATDFQPPQKGIGGATGLYCGEQDLFAFLIDPTGWTEIEGEAFAPGFFVWNSEVGRRSLGIQTFWFQAVCQNHIVWDATDVIEFTRKHTASVHDGLSEIRRLIERLVARRDERRDGFVRVIARAMQERLGADADEAVKTLVSEGIPRGLAAKATELARESGRLTIFSVVDALTRLSQSTRYAGDRAEVDARSAALLALAA